MELEMEDKTQWHPAFCSAMELELREDKAILEFIREYNLSSKPLQMDLLVIKMKAGAAIKNEIGTFFRRHNIFEYKAPGDALNIDTLYKVLGYACLYKADTGDVDAVSAAEITVSLIREGKPMKLLKGLSEKYTVAEEGHGIYRINGMLFPIQVIVTKELDLATHVWLKALTRTMGRAEAEELLESYENLREAGADDRLNADAVVELASDVNDELFKFIIREGGCMSGNLLKLFLTEGGYRSEELKEMIEPELAKLKAIIADKEAMLADNAAMLADNAAMLADKEAMLADSQAEIARLKCLLAEAGRLD